MSKNTTYAASAICPAGVLRRTNRALSTSVGPSSSFSSHDFACTVACKSCPPNPYRREMIHLGTARITSSDPLWT
ncbi:hypothetical protein DIPPA_15362 [Diplonema papillatum]|nr:hypothetical protein DIPPA_15362 [Diplonema papillatum]